MSEKPWRLPSLLGAVVVLLAACTLPQKESSPQPINLTNTVVAKTLVALSTQLAAGGSPYLAGKGTAVPTSPGSTPTYPPFATLIPGPTNPPPCIQASLVRDITLLGEVSIPPGTRFTKTWEVQNNGSCEWNSQFSIVFSGIGDLLGAPPASPLTEVGSIKPGQSGRISLTFQAPSSPGVYQGTWKLRSPQGDLFGVGYNGATALSVHFRVANQYSFVDNLCSAQWEGGTGPLTCPSEENDPKGYFLKQNYPEFETGTGDDEPALVVVPRPGAESQITARFEPVIVPAGSHFKTFLGCLAGYPDCNVHFTLSYQVDGGNDQILGQWDEKYDSSLTRVDIDLQAIGLAGKPVSFILGVRSNGNTSGQRSFWLLPSVTVE